MTIRQLPRDVDHGEVMELLIQSGLPEGKKEDTNISVNGIVSIKNLDVKTCKDLIEAFHGKVDFGKKLFCNGMIPLTPEKPDITVDPPAPAAAAPPGSPASSQSSNPAKSPAFIAAIATFENLDQKQSSEFGSCVSSSSSGSSGSSGEEQTEDEEDSDKGGFKTMNEKKRNKRKLKLTPGKDSFIKKANLVEYH